MGQKVQRKFEMSTSRHWGGGGLKLVAYFFECQTDIFNETSNYQYFTKKQLKDMNLNQVH